MECFQVKVKSDETKSLALKSLQLSQNRLLRLLNKTRVSDRVSVGSMLEKFQLLSVNQLAAEIKIIEVWKSIHVKGCPISMEPYNPNICSTQNLREKPNRIFYDTSRLMVSRNSFNIDAARLWNLTPTEIRQAETLTEAKKLIKKFVKTFPV